MRSGCEGVVGEGGKRVAKQRQFGGRDVVYILSGHAWPASMAVQTRVRLNCKDVVAGIKVLGQQSHLAFGTISTQSNIRQSKRQQSSCWLCVTSCIATSTKKMFGQVRSFLIHVRIDNSKS